jgi:hypothetical protein
MSAGLISKSSQLAAITFSLSPPNVGREWNHWSLLRSRLGLEALSSLFAADVGMNSLATTCARTAMGSLLPNHQENRSADMLASRWNK